MFRYLAMERTMRPVMERGQGSEPKRISPHHRRLCHEKLDRLLDKIDEEDLRGEHALIVIRHSADRIFAGPRLTYTEPLG